MADARGDLQNAEQGAKDRGRQQILNANHGGHNPIAGYTTDFESCGHPYKGLDGLKNMVASADPGAMYEVSRHWKAVASALESSQGQLKSHTQKALESWQGPAADMFARRSQQLQTGLENARSYAAQTGSAMSSASGFLHDAKTALDGIHNAGFFDHVGDVLGGESDTQFRADLKSGIDLGTALQLDGSQLNTEEYRFQQAVLVMQRLGANYNSVSDWLKNHQPPKGGGDGGVYPPTGVADPYPPVGGSNAGLTGPNGSSRSGHGSVGANQVNGMSDIKTPGPNPGLGSTGAGSTSPISGGGVSKLPNPPATSIDGVSGGVPGGSGSSAWNGGGGAGLSGLGGPSSAGSAGLAGAGYALAGMGLGVGGTSGGMAGEGSPAEESLAAERALAEEGAAGRGEGARAGGMMGGMGGLGRGNGRKNKRKQRAAYVVEDEETWAQGVKPNPPVIG